MSDELAQALIVALFGTGGATFIWTLTKSIIAFRDSAAGREDKAVGRLERFEADCRRQLEQERACTAWWQRRAGVLAHTLEVAGVPVPPEHEAPPPHITQNNL